MQTPLEATWDARPQKISGDCSIPRSEVLPENHRGVMGSREQTLRRVGLGSSLGPGELPTGAERVSGHGMRSQCPEKGSGLTCFMVTR